MRTYWALGVVVAAGLLLTGCGSSSGGNEIPLPVVTVSPASTSLPAGGSLQFSAKVVSPTSTVITWWVNNIQGGNATVGTITQSGYYTAPASIPNPSTVTVKAVSSAETSPYGSATVEITTAVSASVAVAPTNATTPVGSTVQFTATVTGVDNTAVTWSVNGVAGGNSTVGTINSAGLYSAPTTQPNPATVAVTATSVVQTSEFASTDLTLTQANTLPLSVGFSLNGNTGNTATASYNGLYASVNICLPSTIQCQTIPNILVDTSSVGLRVFNSALTTIPAMDLLTVQDSAGNQIEECYQFNNGSYAWGPVLIADIGLGGETASAVPIQVIGDTTFTAPTNNCLTIAGGASLSGVQALGANGILGIGTGVGTGVQDCGLNCSGGQTFPGYPYYVCPKNVCQAAPLTLLQQVSNPVASVPKDNNGVVIVLPSIPAAGAPSLPFVNPDGSGLVPAGQLILGIGTESNNALGNATLYATDPHGNFASVLYNGQTYTAGGTLNSSANANYILNSATLGLPECTDNHYYCPNSTAQVTITVNGTNGTSGSVTLNVANADTLFSTNSSYAAFNDLAGPTGIGISTDSFEIGLPFFFGRPVFVGLAGSTPPNKASAPNGYFAF